MLPSNRSNSTFLEMLSGLKPGVMFVGMIFIALIAFEVFNYSTTDLALSDLLGDLTFVGVPWSTMLAIAFCGIDFAGIARLFTPETGADEPKEVWYLFGAWLLAATINAILTWWGVSMAVANHQIASSAVVDPSTITGIVPVFVAIMVWVIRILIIGTLSLSVDRILHPEKALIQAEERQAAASRASLPQNQPVMRSIPQNIGSASIPQRPMPRAAAPASSARTGGHFSSPSDDAAPIAEPTYHSLSGRPDGNRTNTNSANDRYRRS